MFGQITKNLTQCLLCPQQGTVRIRFELAHPNSLLSEIREGQFWHVLSLYILHSGGWLGWRIIGFGRVIFGKSYGNDDPKRNWYYKGMIAGYHDLSLHS